MPFKIIPGTIVPAGCLSFWNRAMNIPLPCYTCLYMLKMSRRLFEIPPCKQILYFNLLLDGSTSFTFPAHFVSVLFILPSRNQSARNPLILPGIPAFAALPVSGQESAPNPQSPYGNGSRRSHPLMIWKFRFLTASCTP